MDRLSLLVFAVATIVSPAYAAPLDQFQAHIKEASQRFDIPARWIEAVIMAESSGDPNAISPKGAMGLMQLMPETWAELRDQHDLGADPFDPRGNVLAGASYLRAMQDRFGYSGLFAAYNAGPGRYEEHLRTGKPLPAETRAYIADLEKTLANRTDIAPGGAAASPSNGRDLMKIFSSSGLFFPLSASRNGERGEGNSPASGELFAPLSTRKSDGR